MRGNKTDSIRDSNNNYACYALEKLLVELLTT